VSKPQVIAPSILSQPPSPHSSIAIHGHHHHEQARAHPVHHWASTEIDGTFRKIS
jgi:hypothetical protein